MTEARRDLNWKLTETYMSHSYDPLWYLESGRSSRTRGGRVMTKKPKHSREEMLSECRKMNLQLDDFECDVMTEAFEMILRREPRAAVLKFIKAKMAERPAEGGAS